MKVFFIVGLLFFTIQLPAQSDREVLERALFELPDVQFKLHSKPEDKHLTYLLTIRQPLDHTHPEKGFFINWLPYP